MRGMVNDHQYDRHGGRDVQGSLEGGRSLSVRTYLARDFK